MNKNIFWFISDHEKEIKRQAVRPRLVFDVLNFKIEHIIIFSKSFGICNF